MRVAPRNDYVLVELDKTPEVTEQGGFGLDSDSVKERLRATVLATGPGRLTLDGTRIPIRLKSQVRVWLYPGSGQVVDDNEDFLLIKEELIIGVIDGPE
jgi:chaperonin GroES